MAKGDFVTSPMDYASGPTNPKPSGEFNGDPNFPKRSDYGAGVTEKTLEAWPTEDVAIAAGSPIVDAVIRKDNSIT